MAIPIHSNIFTTIIMAFTLFVSPHVHFTRAESIPIPSFAFSWLDDKDTFQAGDIATVMVKVLGNFDNDGNKTAFNPTVTVNNKMGNSSFITGIFSQFGNDTNDWKIIFIPILNGKFSLIIIDVRFDVLDSSLSFTARPGKMYPSASLASWKGLVNEFVAGTKARVQLLPKDAFGNNISTNSEEPNPSVFKLYGFRDNGSIINLQDIVYLGWNKVGFVSIEFLVTVSGDLSLHVEGGNQTLNGSPLLFKVNPGPLDVSNCLAKWNFETNYLQIFSKLQVFLHQRDQYGNLVPGLHEFDAEVVENGTNLSIPIADLRFNEVMPGIQLFSFSVLEAGYFMLTIYDMKLNKSISNMPLGYTVFVGYCDGSKSIVNGSGVNSSIAGEESKFSVYLSDTYQYPSFVEIQTLRVQIVRKIDSLFVKPTIRPMHAVNGSGPLDEIWSYRHFHNTEFAHSPSVSPGSRNDRASAFEVIYTPVKTGVYDIIVLCGNIPLNGGHSFVKEVGVGEVNISLSGVVKFAPKVPKLLKNEIMVLLVDSLNNSVPSQPSRLKLEIASIKNSSLSSWMFVDNNDGSYSVQYVIEEVGTYKICASFDAKRLSPCPFDVNVYSGEYFPKANDDSIIVWEDESISLDALANDYFASGNSSISDYSKPRHGSLLQHEHIFRYTPYRDFYGTDNFSYTMTDVNGNMATGFVNISVLITPPRFVPFVYELEATEDMMSPRYGGFPGFEIRYSDLEENISVILSAQSGTMFLSPMLMQFWQPMYNPLVVKNGGTEAKDLILEGPVELLNFAVQSIQYFGNQDMYGSDVIRISTINRNGMNDMNVSVFVEPVNDPPVIQVPKYIIFNKTNGIRSRIFDKERDKFDFSVWDPDLPNFPGGESGFVVTFSLEVDSGVLITDLPSELINSTELKVKNTYQWRPLQTFVTISKHSLVQAKGIRIRGSLKDCNTIMQELFYDGGEDAVLKVILNDMGTYGRDFYYMENISMPLIAVATVNLITRGPIGSSFAHGLGTVILFEFIFVFFLGLTLLFFTCKCAFVLVNERRKRRIENGNELSTGARCFEKQPSCAGLWRKMKTSDFSKGPKTGIEERIDIDGPLPSLAPLSIEN